MGATPDSDGKAIDGYHPVHRVAQSYLGSLWIAVDKRGGGSEEKLRLLRRVHLPVEVSDEVRRAMAAVGRDALRVRHGNVLGVVDVLERDGMLAMAYEHLEAEPLRSLQSWAKLRCLSFPVGVCLRIIMDVLRGVEAIHQAYAATHAQAVFGGLSPDSVLVARDGTTRVSDPLVSGCASLLDAIGFNTAKLAYAAPEQIHPVAPLTPQCDLFTCGAMLWELLATRRLLAGSRPAIERKLLEHDLPSLSAYPRASDPLSPALIALVDRALAGDPAQRPQSALEMADDLAACGHDIATLAEVAHFVGKLSGQRFDRRTAAVRSKSLPQLDTPLEWPIEVPTTPGAKRRGAREASAPFTLAPTPVVPLAAAMPPARPLPAPPLAAPPRAPLSTPVEARTTTGLGNPRHPALTPSLPFANLTPEPFSLGSPALAPSKVVSRPPVSVSKPPSTSSAPSFMTSFGHASVPSEEARRRSSPRPAPREAVQAPAGSVRASSELTRGGWARAWRMLPRQAHRHAWLGLSVVVLAVPLTLGLVIWLRGGPVAAVGGAVIEPSVIEAGVIGPTRVDSSALDRPAIEATAPKPRSPALQDGGAPRAPESRRDFSSPTLDDDQLVELFALERRSELPSCEERLGESASEYSGKDPKQSLQQLKAARREMMRGNDIAAHGFLCGAIAHDPTHVAAQQTFAELALQLGDPAQAKAAVEGALERSPRNTNLLTLLGDALAVLGDIPGSRAVWLGTLPRKGTPADRTRRLASSYRLMGDRAVETQSFGQARVYYRRAIILTAGGFGPSLGLSEALMWLRHSRASLAWAERAARAFPKDSRVQLLFGDALYENRRPEKARAAWQAALDAQPNSRAAARRLSRGKP